MRRMCESEFTHSNLHVCWGLNSLCFPIVGMVINLIVEIYIPVVRIPVIKGGMTMPNIRSSLVTFMFSSLNHVALRIPVSALVGVMSLGECET